MQIKKCNQPAFPNLLEISARFEVRLRRAGIERHQNLSATKFRPRKEASSSYRPLFDRLGSFTFDCFTFLYGMSSSSAAMQFSRARFLSSDLTMCHDAYSVSLALNI